MISWCLTEGRGLQKQTPALPSCVARKVPYSLWHCFVHVQLTQLKDESQREKDGMVVKYAQSEQRNIELAEKLQKAEAAMKDSATEKENLTTYLSTLRADKQKLKDMLEKRVCQFCQLFNQYYTAVFKCKLKTELLNKHLIARS